MDVRRKHVARLFVWLVGFANTISLPAQAQVWDFLGDTQIDGTCDHGRIQVTRRNGVFHAIQLRVSDAIFFDRVIVHFGDGTSEELAVQGRIWPGGKNRVIGFPGQLRVVESVELWYYKEPWEHSPRVILYGS
jgi:hypothetical protein